MIYLNWACLRGAIKGLVTGTVDVQILNRLLEHKNFPKLMDLIRIYFQDTAAKGIIARNRLIELATVSLSDLMKEHLEHRAEANAAYHRRCSKNGCWTACPDGRGNKQPISAVDEENHGADR